MGTNSSHNRMERGLHGGDSGNDRTGCSVYILNQSDYTRTKDAPEISAWKGTLQQVQ